MYKRKIELTTVVELIEELKQLTPKTKVYTNGTHGYMHIGKDENGDDCVSFDDKQLNEEYSSRYEAVLGFNTKQWWAYDNETDEYCDPPSKVLEEISMHSDDIDKQEKFFNDILSEEPDWLNDEEHRYDNIDI